MDYEEYYRRLELKNIDENIGFLFSLEQDKYSKKKRLGKNIHIGLNISTKNSPSYNKIEGLIVELVIKDKQYKEIFFNQLKKDRKEIEEKLATKIEWKPGDKSYRIYAIKDVELDNNSEWNHYIDWHLNIAKKFIEIFPSYISNLNKNKEINSIVSFVPGIIYADDVNEDFFEGIQKQVTVNFYERNPKARKKCLEYHGYNCSVCNLNFEDKYGYIGKDFIHVHHLKQISDIKEEYLIDPIKDLIPVCPNCHAMIHKRNPPYSVGELQKIINK